MWVAALVLFIELHAADGSVVQVNPQSIISMRSRGTGGHFVEGTNCLLNMADGKYITVREDCIKVFKMIEEEP